MPHISFGITMVFLRAQSRTMSGTKRACIHTILKINQQNNQYLERNLIMLNELILISRKLYFAKTYFCALAFFFWDFKFARWILKFTSNIILETLLFSLLCKKRLRSLVAQGLHLLVKLLPTLFAQKLYRRFWVRLKFSECVGWTEDTSDCYRKILQPPNVVKFIFLYITLGTLFIWKINLIKYRLLILSLWAMFS